jgi:4-aminobutyrate aminotransferase-like enzyme
VRPKPTDEARRVSQPAVKRIAVLSTALVHGAEPLVRVKGGRGSRLILDDGREVIDASNPAAPLGHCHPELIEAVRGAAASPALDEGWEWGGRAEAAEALLQTCFASEPDWVGGVRFCSSGSEANDMALSLAQAITGRTPLATRERAYHGMLGLARDTTVQPQWHGGLSSFSGGARPVPRSVPVRQLPSPRCRIYDETSECARLGRCTCVGNASELLDGAAAVILDYSQGGIYPSPLHQDAVAEAARDAGALWIADEVVTGLGREGCWLNYLRGDARPDLVTLGKPLGGGAAAAAAVVISSEMLEALQGQTWQTYSTFRGHPVVVAAVAATLRIIDRDGLVDRVASLDSKMRDGLTEIAAKHDAVEGFDGLGFDWTLELVGGDWRNYLADSAEAPVADQVTRAALDEGALIATSGEQTQLFLAPPLNCPEDDLDRILEALDSGLEVADRMLD